MAIEWLNYVAFAFIAFVVQVISFFVVFEFLMWRYSRDFDMAMGRTGDEVRLRVANTDGSGIAEVSVFDSSYSAPMKEDYAVTGGAEIILTVDSGRFEVVENE